MRLAVQAVGKYEVICAKLIDDLPLCQHSVNQPKPEAALPL
jgi:hypothetical protein